MLIARLGRSLSASDNSPGFASLFSTFADVGAAVFAFVLTIATAQLLGPSGRGEVTAVISLCGLAYLLGTMGLASANVFFAARKSIPYPTLLGNSLLQGILLGLATCAALIMVAYVFPSILGSIPLKSLAIAAAFFPITFTELYLSYLILGRQRFFASNVLLFTARATSSIVILVGCLLMPEPVVVILLVQSYSVFRIILNLGYMRRTGLLPRPELNLHAFWTSLIYALKGRGNDIFQFLNLRFDIFILNALSGTAATGIYSVAVIISEVAWFPSYGAAKVLFPRSAAATNSDEDLVQIQRTCRIIATLCAGIALVMAIVGYFAIPLVFGAAFTDARTALWLLVPGTICFPISQILSSALSGRGSPHIGSLVGGAGFVLTLGLDLFLIPRYHANGAAVASSIAYSFTALLSVVLFSWSTKSRAIALVKPTREDLRLLIAFINQGWSALKNLTAKQPPPTISPEPLTLD